MRITIISILLRLHYHIGAIDSKYLLINASAFFRILLVVEIYLHESFHSPEENERIKSKERTKQNHRTDGGKEQTEEKKN